MKQPLKMNRLRWVGSMVWSALVLIGCGSSDDGGGGGTGGDGSSGAAGGDGDGGRGGSGAGGAGGDPNVPSNGSGTVTATWADFCTGTFTEDTDVLDPFDDLMFTIAAGQEYLLIEYSTSNAEFVFLTDVGPETFDIEPDASGAFPFTSNCEPARVVDYYAVFTDVSVYAEATLTTKLCDLPAGTVLPATTGGRGFATAGGALPDGSLPYRIVLNAFSAQCGGAESGYISVPRTEVFGTTTWLVPFVSIIGPE